MSCSSINSTTEKTNTKVRTFLTRQTTQRCSKPPKSLNVSVGQTLSMKRSGKPVLPVCLRPLDGLSQRSILALVAFCLCSLGSGCFFFLCLWKKSFSSKLHAMRGERKKRKKLTEQEMMTQLYGNHFRTRTRNQGRAGHMKRCRWSSAHFRAV